MVIEIYNTPFRETSSDVIVLDPPEYIDISIFVCKYLILFMGNKLEYRKQLDGYVYEWRKFIDGELYSDLLLLNFKWNEPCPYYVLPSFKDRYGFWERPVGLMMSLLSDTEGDVLDPFMGSGATAVACRNLNRNFTGYEIDSDLCEIARGRL